MGVQDLTVQMVVIVVIGADIVNVQLAAAALRFRSDQGFRCTPQAYAEPAHSCGVVYFGANGAYVLSVSILFSSGENRTVFVMFCLCSTEALRRAAA